MAIINLPWPIEFASGRRGDSYNLFISEFMKNEKAGKEDNHGRTRLQGRPVRYCGSLHILSA